MGDFSFFSNTYFMNCNLEESLNCVFPDPLFRSDSDFKICAIKGIRLF